MCKNIVFDVLPEYIDFDVLSEYIDFDVLSEYIDFDVLSEYIDFSKKKFPNFQSQMFVVGLSLKTADVHFKYV